MLGRLLCKYCLSWYSINLCLKEGLRLIANKRKPRIHTEKAYHDFSNPHYIRIPVSKYSYEQYNKQNTILEEDKVSFGKAVRCLQSYIYKMTGDEREHTNKTMRKPGVVVVVIYSLFWFKVNIYCLLTFSSV